MVDAEANASIYADLKQGRLEALITSGSFAAFPDALRFVRSLIGLGLSLAVASSSKNANQMLKRVLMDGGKTLFDVFEANVCGRDLPRGKPDPAIFLLAASELDAAPSRYFVIEDAAVGIQAARAGGMAGLGVARLHDEALLQAVLASDLCLGPFRYARQPSA